MRNIAVIPFQSANQVQLGQSRQEVYKEIGIPSRTSGKADFYQESLPFFSVHYDAADRVEYIEISNPENKEVKILVSNLDIFNTEALELVNKLKETTGFDYDQELPEIPHSFTFPEMELSLWRPVLPENETDPDGRYFETVGIGIKGYYTS